MDPSGSRFPWKTAAAAAAVLLAAFLVRLASRLPQGSFALPSAGSARPVGGDEGASAGAPAEGADALPAAEPAGERGYVRRLVVVEPPSPGERSTRSLRGDEARRQETALGSGASFAGPAGSFAAEFGEGSGSGPSWRAAPPPPPEEPAVTGGSAGAPGAASSAGKPPSAAAAAPARDGGGARDPGASDAGSSASGPADAVALADATSAASRLVTGAQGRLRAAASGGPLTPESVATALRQQIAKDEGTATSVRSALAALPAGAPEEAQEDAVAGALAAAGEPAEPEDVALAMAAAELPPRPAPSPQAVDSAIRAVSTDLPGAAKLDALARTAMEPQPKPNAPPPKGGVDAYLRYRDAFDRVEKDYGLKPSQLVPFPAIETSLGRNTGKFPLRDTLLAIYTDPKGRFKPSQRKQAGRDLAALTRLLAHGDLGGRKVEQIYGSNMGAIGITQFLPTSWEAYGRSMAGGKRDPWDFRDAVLSTGNYLEKHGSRRDYDRAILSYNHSEDYRRKIRQYGANVAPGIAAVRREEPAAAPPKTP